MISKFNCECESCSEAALFIDNDHFNGKNFIMIEVAEGDESQIVWLSKEAIEMLLENLQERLEKM